MPPDKESSADDFDWTNLVTKEDDRKVISDLLLGVVNWWCLKFGKKEVIDLIVRHFQHEDIYKAICQLADGCGLPQPSKHKNTAARPAIEPCASDLASMTFDLIDKKRLPIIVIPACDLGKVPLDALSINDERSVGARLESLEASFKVVLDAVQKLSAPGPVSAQPPQIDVSNSLSGNVTPKETFTDVAKRHLNNVSHSAANVQISSDRQLTVPNNRNRSRSRSPQPNDQDQGFRKQGRPRLHNRAAASGTSK